jgi:Xaa-Pro aminopeptidase
VLAAKARVPASHQEDAQMASNHQARPSPIVQHRLASLRRVMKSKGIGALLISRHMDYHYLTGFTGEDSAVLLTNREVHVISDGRFDVALNRECAWARRWLRKKLLHDEVAHVCSELRLKRLSVQPEGMTVDEFIKLRALANGTTLEHAPPAVADLRKIKDDSEVKAIRKAIRVAEDAFRALLDTLAIGQTERDVAARLEYEMKQRGASDPSFPTIVAEGPNAALPHAHPGTRKLRRGSALLLDWGARVGMYCSDLTRVVFIGSIPPKIGRIYDIVLEAQRRAIAAIRPKVRVCEVDRVAREYIEQAGFGAEFNHGLGHGIGLNIHEAPSLSWRSDEPLAAGMVVTVEPGIYLEGVGGVRIEDDVLVTPNGHRVLSRLERGRDRMVLAL